MRRHLGAYGDVGIRLADGALVLVTKKESLLSSVRFFPTGPSTSHGIDTTNSELVSLTFDDASGTTGCSGSGAHSYSIHDNS